MTISHPLELGRIVWAFVADANGFRKLRLAVIVTATNQITADKLFEVIAVTTRLPEPLPNDFVLLPWHAQGHARTRLNRKCAAVCSWRCTISTHDIQDLGGVVPGECLLDILTRMKSYQ